MSDKPTEMDLIKLEIRDLLASVGEVRLGWDAMFKRIAAMEERLRRLESPRAMVGSIQGLEGEWSVTPPPEFEA